MSDLKSKKILVIGGGLGGLSAAISLATEGFTVELYEKNEKVGGKLNVLQQDGFTFDLGPSILTLPHIFEVLFERAGKKAKEYVEFEEVTPHWRNFFEDGTSFDLTPDMRRMEAELQKFPVEDSHGFFAFLEYSRKLCKLTEEGFFPEGIDTLRQFIAHYGWKKSTLGFDVLRTMNGGVSRFIRNPKLRDVLNYFIKYVGSSPYDAPALMNLLAYVQFGYGLWYVKGGMYNLARGLERLACELGVKLHLNCEVTEITKTDSLVNGIRYVSKTNDCGTDAKDASADIIVSNMEVLPAYNNLLGEDEQFLSQYKKFAPACSGLVLHLGVDCQYPQLAHHNFFYSRDSKRHFKTVFKEQRLPDDPTIYLVAPVKTDPGQAPEGSEVIKVLPHIPPIREDGPFSRTDYLNLRERVLEKLERMGLTDLRKHIVVEDMWTPDDIRSNYYSHRGAIYGVITHRSLNKGFKFPKRSEKYSNLYFVGGSVNPGGGMPMVVLSGQNVRDRILAELATA